MRKWNVLLVVGILVLPFWVQAHVFQDVPPVAQQISEKIQLAIQNYKEDKIPEGAILLCDVVLSTRPRTSWPDGFAETIDSARNIFQKGQLAEGIGHIKRAIEIFKPDHETSSEKGDGSMAAITQLVLNKIESAVENFKSGDADLAVLLILESLTLLSPAH